MHPDLWRARRVLVTGHTGFKGAWLTYLLELAGAEVTGLALPPEARDGAYAVLAPRFRGPSHQVDLRQPAAVADAVSSARPEVVFHLAAQALVRRSYADPEGTYDTNVMGTLHLLRALEDVPALAAIVVSTTDKVYRHGGAPRPFQEEDPLGGTDPYSASKACTEIVVESWRATSGAAPVATARAGNVIGGGDWGLDRLIPDFFRAAREGSAVRLRFPEAIRPWQFVLDPLHGYVLLAERLLQGAGLVPEALNFGPPSEEGSWTVAAVIDRLAEVLGAGSWTLAGGDQPAEAAVLRLDASRAAEVLGWRSRLSLEDALQWTADWYRTQLAGGDAAAVTEAQVVRYLSWVAA
jgi:CDP-glucose 4,6-dehydratase